MLRGKNRRVSVTYLSLLSTSKVEKSFLKSLKALLNLLHVLYRVGLCRQGNTHYVYTTGVFNPDNLDRILRLLKIQRLSNNEY